MARFILIAAVVGQPTNGTYTKYPRGQTIADTAGNAIAGDWIWPSLCACRAPVNMRPAGLGCIGTNGSPNHHACGLGRVDGWRCRRRECRGLGHFRGGADENIGWRCQHRLESESKERNTEMSVFDEIQIQRAKAVAAKLGIPEWMIPMLLAEGNSMRGVMADVRRMPVHSAAGCGPEPECDTGRCRKSLGPRTGTGWREAMPLGPQPGIALVDRLCDAADRAERRARG